MAVRRVEFKVVGMTFPPVSDDYPGSFYRIAAAAEALEAEWWRGQWAGLDNGTEAPRLPALLIRNPDNAVDPNAVQVHVPMLGRRSMIGHAPAEVAARLAPSLDAGRVYHAEVLQVLVKDEHAERPGAKIKVWRDDVGPTNEFSSKPPDVPAEDGSEA